MTKYQELADKLRADLLSGELIDPDRLPKGRLPSHTEIEERYGYSAGAVARAIALLKAENIIHTTAAGTFPNPAGIGSWKWVLTCIDCPATFEAPRTLMRSDLDPLLAANGWASRVTPRGWRYFCTRHNPWSDS